ncbi:SEC-C metal-binding domain-containing protein [Gracilibacillus salinarum]|uniref:SEC-C domain-containing protein n=1 Tax=Gracilibacillus salinarum TaxID=2932255 RepID=A0ABY4GHQ9_9BACI|nr:SEC-C metal-binding domain-containing protein [Gracilibacillus salinarum]UOQ83730.1 SEC-C domain-containing protein [Gracilibacillus salinarum]
MSVKRNDPCPCGSGKKYKKCCMKQDNLVELKEWKEEKFLLQKNKLVDQMKDFIAEKVPLRDSIPLESQFKQRINHILDDDKQEGYLQFWLFFFNRYKNGLRGIEWFLKEEGHRLAAEERKMAEQWAQLKPQFVQAVDYTDQHVIFQDAYSDQLYYIPRTLDSQPFVIPWMSTFGLLEEVHDEHYFNGVRAMLGPISYYNAIQYVENMAKKKNLDREQVMFDYYPEILVAMHTKLDEQDWQEKEISFYKYEFELVHQERGEKFLYNDPSFDIDVWEPGHKQLTWVSEVKGYTDSELTGEVYVMDVDANIEIKNNILTFTTYELKTVNQFLKKLAKVPDTFRLINDQEEVITTPVNMEVRQSAVRLEEKTPPYFGMYAQMMDQMDIDKPIPKYDHQSLRQLVENGQEQVADRWLKNQEFDIYKFAREQFGMVDITPDFNTPRRALGLALSPFVTGGKQRNSEIKSIPVTKERQTVVVKEDIPMYERLGITAQTVDAFYTNDIIEFYREKTAGKSRSTEAKYGNRLNDIREVLEKRNIQSWQECDLPFWKRFITQDMLDLYGNDVSNKQWKELLTVVKGFAKWLANEGKITIDKEIIDFAKQC